MDMWVEGNADLTQLPADLQEAVPPGLTILNVASVDEKSPPLQTQVLSAEYCVDLPQENDHGQVDQKVNTLMQTASLPRERRGKAYDLRPLIEQMDALKEFKLFMRLSSREGATGRPEEVLDALGLPLDGARIERTKLIFKDPV